jgi:hypothetical protein
MKLFIAALLGASLWVRDYTIPFSPEPDGVGVASPPMSTRFKAVTVPSLRRQVFVIQETSSDWDDDALLARQVYDLVLVAYAKVHFERKTDYVAVQAWKAKTHSKRRSYKIYIFPIGQDGKWRPRTSLNKITRNQILGAISGVRGVGLPSGNT